jgi:hypothetical protein
MPTVKKAYIEPAQQSDYKYWAKVVDEFGQETFLSAHSKLSLLSFLSDMGNIEIIVQGPSEEAVSPEKALSALLKAIPESFTIDDDRIPDGYDTHETVIPYIQGANRVIGGLRKAFQDLGLQHRDSKFSSDPVT